MANLLVLVLDQLEKCPAILEAWSQAGVPGITVVDSAGARALEKHAIRDDMPLMPSLRSLFAADEMHNRILFTVIEDESVLERAVAAVHDIVGDLAEPDSGIMFVVPVSRTWGVRKTEREK
jgi:nitrogen regulatory protein PII